MRKVRCVVLFLLLDCFVWLREGGRLASSGALRTGVPV